MGVLNAPRWGRPQNTRTGLKNSAGSRMAKKVLIVEDNELNMKLFHDLLDAQGYASHVSAN